MLRQFYYQFLPYRSFFAPFLLVTAFVVPCWLIFRLYRLRTRGERLSITREFVLLTAAVYVAGLCVATLTPNRSDRLLAQGRGGIELRPNVASLTCSAALLPAEGSARGFCLHNAKGNAALFFPLGILLPLIWRRLRFWKGVQIAIALSITIELVQYFSSAWGSYRAADINDVILNVAGASLGLALVFLLRLATGRRPVAAHT